MDPDVDLHIPADRAEAVGHHLWTVVAAVAAGGVIGACARYGASLVWPVAAGTFPWTTFGVNVVGCALIGVLMVLVVETREAHPLVRPFLGTGVLGGFTTFSAYAVDLVELLDRGRAVTAAGYAAGTLGAALGGVGAAAALTRAAVRRRTAPGVPAGNGGGSR
ncbi:fluoride efflux transporter FluC [Streptomyces sp. NPDC001922]|uniref:fluoride efflux transporter FluC n=1 Tax=Streptomyces sp. NPDC001922 TaxID=3364624 RepID=UPI003698DD75